jgi:hypothetical protein
MRQIGDVHIAPFLELCVHDVSTKSVPKGGTQRLTSITIPPVQLIQALEKNLLTFFLTSAFPTDEDPSSVALPSAFCMRREDDVERTRKGSVAVSEQGESRITPVYIGAISQFSHEKRELLTELYEARISIVEPPTQVIVKEEQIAVKRYRCSDVKRSNIVTPKIVLSARFPERALHESLLRIWFKSQELQDLHERLDSFCWDN